LGNRVLIRVKVYPNKTILCNISFLLSKKTLFFCKKLSFTTKILIFVVLQANRMTAKELLKHYWNYDKFRPLQEDIIQAVLAGKDTLALLPTGGGKSICFQIPALALDGLCVVVSPLIALMKDQVEQLRKRGILADAIFSGMSSREIDRILDNAAYGGLKFLYVSPERLQTELFLARAKKMKITLLAIDEAHCISQWGYDFRPPYLEIIEFRKLIPHVPCIALTATATKAVKIDIEHKLGFGENSAFFQQSFSRANLSYSVFEVENKEAKLVDILQKVAGSAVVYVQSRRKAALFSDFLCRNGIRADYYHAGLPANERSRKQDAWIKNQIRVIVATNAFGMGIDKPDVRVVVHVDLPNTLEAYYQEAGRAGRDEKKAYAVLLHYQTDATDLKQKIESAYPSPETLRKVYQQLANYYNLAVGSSAFASYDFDVLEFQKNFQIDTITTYHSIKQLEQEGFIQVSEAFYHPSKLLFTVSNTDLYAFQIANANLDAIIKVVLRMYGGDIFNNFVAINEQQIARQMHTDTKTVVQQLQFLHQSTIVSYSPQKDKSQLTFTTPRFKAEELPIDSIKLEKFKQRDLEKAQAVTQYLQQKQRCRTQLLLEYFGEINDKTCQVCDVCLQKKKTQQLPILHSPSIKEVLANKSLPLQELIAQIKPSNTQQFIAEIQAMVASKELQQTTNGEIALSNKTK
jgi:ATP-dependent DNA helicase RecQ